MRSISTLILAGLLLVGCKTQPEQQSANSTTLLPAAPMRTRPPTAAPPGKIDAFDTDDCASRMHTLEGQLILYYFKYHRLPMVLDELRSVADPGEDVPAMCPVSHQPYTYNRDGLVFGTDADMRRLVVYDSSPAHAGTRWGVLFSQAKGNAPVNMQVIQIPEAALAGYHPAPPSAVSPTTSAATPDEIPPDIRARMEEQLRLKRIEQLRLQRQQQDDPQPNPQLPEQPLGQQPSPQLPGRQPNQP